MSTAPASDLVRTEWLHRVEAEYRSSALTQHLTLWLTQAGASPDLILAGLRISADEIDHADLSMETFVAAGGAGAPALTRASLEHPVTPGEPLELAIARVGVDAFCLGETVAVPLFKQLREGCTVPVARRALDRILRDEVRHRDFGWTLLTWLLEGPHAADVRALLGRELPRFFARVRESYAPAFARTYDHIAEADRAWGLIAPARYAEVVRRTLTRDWKPRFARLGVDAVGAWNQLSPNDLRHTEAQG
ncbi:MAG: ferritin-like domain-containing protein [Polyangiales bacterium]